MAISEKELIGSIYKINVAQNDIALAMERYGYRNESVLADMETTFDWAEIYRQQAIILAESLGHNVAIFRRKNNMLELTDSESQVVENAQELVDNIDTLVSDVKRVYCD